MVIGTVPLFSVDDMVGLGGRTVETRILLAYGLIALLVAGLIASAIWLRRNTAEANRLPNARRERASRIRGGTGGV